MLEDGQGPKAVRFCARCYKLVDPLDGNSQRNPTTKKWEHKDCRASPRTHEPRDRYKTRT